MDLSYRQPSEALWNSAAVAPSAFEAKPDSGFLEILAESKSSLVVSREYEHFLLALSADSNKKLRQSHFEIPHPSGLAWNPHSKRLAVASTRNPNLLAFFRLYKNQLQPECFYVLPGSMYLHDLVWKNSKTLWLNSVGTNSIWEWCDGKIGKRVWTPPSLARSADRLTKNTLQLNSIALGKGLRDSFFTSSCEKPDLRYPGDPEWPVNERGVVWQGTGKIVARGLTRPHSARLHQRRVWVCNSGYGEFGWIEAGKFRVLTRLPGWTRGVSFYRDYGLVATSPVLKRFESYAPGLTPSECVSGLHWVELKTGKIKGSCTWPQGGQHFGIEVISRVSGLGFSLC